MNWNNKIKQRVGNNKYPTLRRIKWGKRLMVVAAIPAGTSWMAVIAVPMMITITPTLWAIDKVRYFNGSISEPSLWSKGRLNERKGNGDLKL